MDDDVPPGRITFDEHPDPYERWGAAVGGAVLGFIIVGYLSLRLFRHSDGFLPLVMACLGACLGAWYQVKYGDYWWKRLAGWVRWW